MTADMILNRAADGQTISKGDLLILLNNAECTEKIIKTADALNRSVNDEKVTFVHNRNINYTNICINHCLFCGFRVGKKDPGAYVMNEDDVLNLIEQSPGITEICVQGGLNPDLGFEYVLRLVKTVKNAFPRIHVHGFSPMEIVFFSRLSGFSVEDVINDLMEAGLGSMPGTAAEILDDNIRKTICPDKIRSAEWTCVIKTAHRLSLRTTSTIMIGHLETNENLSNHLDLVRRIQEETGGFTEFIPLFFMPKKTELARQYQISGTICHEQALKFIALTRIFFNGLIPNIQASWPTLGIDGAGACLSAGANDLGGTLYSENITRSAGGENGQFISPDEFQSVIRRSGKIPCLRDTLYNLIDWN